jgi:hypothetical protein
MKKLKSFAKNVLNFPAKLAGAAVTTVAEHFENTSARDAIIAEAKRRKEVTDILCDPKRRLTGPQRRQLMRQLETVFYTGRPQQDLAHKLTGKLLRTPFARLAKMPGKVARRIRRIQGQIDNGTARTKTLLAPNLHFLKLWQSALGDIIKFRTQKVG